MAFIEYEDAVVVHDGFEPVGNGDDNGTSEFVTDSRLNLVVA